MWKYVSRCIKDTVERPCNFLACSSSTYPVPDEKSTSPKRHSIKPRFSCPIRNRIIEYRKRSQWNNKSSSSNDSSSSSADEDEQFRKKFDRQGYHCNFQQNVLGAITWSSAILCGWYTTQLFSIRRRHLAANRCTHPTHNRFDKSRYLQAPNTYKHVFPYWVQAAPVESKNLWNDNDWKKDLHQKIHEINNEEVRPTTKKDGIPSSNEIHTKPTFESAAKDLNSILSDIEFQLGVQNIDAGEYGQAASHFKLATSHHHAGATFNLGICYEQGLGVEKNLKVALECYQTAAAMGHAKAIYNIGIFYIHGLGGLKRNRTLARQYFITAAKLGQVEARDALGIKDFKNDSVFMDMIKI